jgi:hypothetical protein|nr:MAG TPA: hypothetical protein [Caudoviricetes sp.]
MKNRRDKIEKNVIFVGKDIRNDSIIELPKSEYDAMQKQNFIANALMQWLYDNSSLSSVGDFLIFDTLYLSNVLQVIDRDSYFHILAIKQIEEEERNAEKQTRSEEKKNI